jgi:hypothetical protein
LFRAPPPGTSRRSLAACPFSSSFPAAGGIVKSGPRGARRRRFPVHENARETMSALHWRPTTRVSGEAAVKSKRRENDGGRTRLGFRMCVRRQMAQRIGQHS